jgi:hypothetical protein
MTTDLTLAVWALLVAAFVVTEIVALRGSRLPTLGDLLRVLLEPRVGRWLLFAGWLWLGWHVFVRSSRT